MPATNIALPQVGAGHCNFSYNSLSALVWGLTHSKKLFGNFIIIFLNSISTGRDVFQNPHLRQCRTLAAKIARHHHLKPSRPGSFRVGVRAGPSPIFVERLVAGKVLGRRRNKTEHQQRWAVGRVFGLKCIGFEELLELKSILEFQLPTMHCRKWGQDIVTSATTQYQLWFGA